jgi:hypothetical protein
MQKSFSSSSAHKTSHDSALYGRLSIIRVCGALALLLITFVVTVASNDRHGTASRAVVSSNGLSAGMPLP